MSRALPFLAGLAALAAPLQAVAAPAVVQLLPASADYVEGGTLYAPRSGEHRAIITTRYTNGPAVALRRLSVRRETALNADLSPSSSSASTPARLGSRPLPPVFGGFAVTLESMPSPASFTVRPQFQDGPSGRNDFLNLNVYLESDQPQPAGLEFSFVGAWLFPASPGERPAPLPLERLADVSFVLSSQRPAARVAQILVRDADSGAFHVSEASATENSSTIALRGVRWAPLDQHDPSVLGAYAAPTFRRVDHVGLYVTVSSTRLDEALRPYGVIYNVALHSLEYSSATR